MSGGGAVYCFVSSPTLINCTLVNSWAGQGGGGIYCNLGSPTLIDCTISGNEVNSPWGYYGGGGVYCAGSSPTFVDCTIAENSAAGGQYEAGYGGGLSCVDGDPILSGCTFERNTAHIGGGVCCWEGSNPKLINCTIAENSALEHGYEYIASNGGGVNSYGSSPMLANCKIVQNAADDNGGGVSCYGGNPTLANCLISANTAGEAGGALYSRAWSSATLINGTLADNDAPSGRAVACDSYDWAGPSSVFIVNSILWNGGDEIWNNDDSTITMTYSDVLGGWEGQGNIDADPLFIDPDNGDLHLSPRSPCIDAGCNWALPPDTSDLDEDGDTEEITPLDLDGEGRFFDDPDMPDTGCGCPPIVDMGAYEFGDTGPQPCPGDLDCDRIVGHSDLGVLLAAWHWSDGGDLDCDGDTDESDLAILLAHWGEECP